MPRLPLLSLIITLTLLPIHTLSVNVTNIKLGSSITASNTTTPWRSPGGDFSFGFQSPKNVTTKFMVAIWFSLAPGQTMAWFARNCDPVPLGSVLALKPQGFVVLDSKQNTLCKVNGDLSGVTYASLSDAGNLVLSNGGDSLWESFKYPTDTILPTQTIEKGTQLISKKSESDFSTGRFYARMTSDGIFALNTKPVPTNSDYENEYYNSQSPGYRVSFTETSDNNSVIFVVSNEGDTVKSILRSNLTSFNLTSSSGFYYRATMDVKGVFTIYYFSKTAFDWVAVATLPEDVCMSIMGDKGSGACGYNNVCYIQNRRPVCNCMEGFSLVDETNSNGDCKWNFTGSSLVTVKDVDWPLNDYEQIKPSTLIDCKEACIDDMFCRVAIYRDNSCWKKRMPLSNGRQDLSLNVTAFLKVGKGY